MTRLSGRLSAAVALLLTAGLLTQAPASADPDPGDPGPIHAGNTFKWGNPKWREEFEPDVDTPRPVDKYWKIRGRGLVQEQHGMLTLNTTNRGNVSATLQRKGRKVGRWEIRLRSRSFGTGATYTVLTSLVPAGGRKQHCGGRNIELESYPHGAPRADFAIHTLPRRAFTASRALDLGDDEWHVFAVEVTKRRISWFVDSQVVTSERRKRALSHTPFTVRFTMVAQGDRTMNPSRMQMDWLRYWTLKNKNQKSVSAPAARATTNPSAC